MAKTNDEFPKRIVVVGVMRGPERPLSEETEEPVPAAAPPWRQPRRSPDDVGKKKVWTSPTLSGSSLLEGMKKLAERISSTLARGVTTPAPLVTLEQEEHEEDSFVDEDLDMDDEVWPSIPAPLAPTCPDPNCNACAAKRRHDLALLNSQLILGEAYLRMRN